MAAAKMFAVFFKLNNFGVQYKRNGVLLLTNFTNIIVELAAPNEGGSLSELKKKVFSGGEGEGRGSFKSILYCKSSSASHFRYRPDSVISQNYFLFKITPARKRVFVVLDARAVTHDAAPRKNSICFGIHGLTERKPSAACILLHGIGLFKQK